MSEKKLPPEKLTPTQKDIDPLITTLVQADEQGKKIGQPLDPDKTASQLKKLRQAVKS